MTSPKLVSNLQECSKVTIKLCVSITYTHNLKINELSIKKIMLVGMLAHTFNLSIEANRAL